MLHFFNAGLLQLSQFDVGSVRFIITYIHMYICMYVKVSDITSLALVPTF